MAGTIGKRRNVAAVWLLLPIVTLGIYSLVWYYKVNREVKEYDSEIKVSPAKAVLTMLFGWILVVPPFISVYNTGKRIAQAQKTAGLDSQCSPVVGLILVFVAGLHTLYYQSALNQIWERHGGQGEAAKAAPTATAAAE
ncbi:DUF4234 domain-containing protein [Flindersiella endophytica]